MANHKTWFAQIWPWQTGHGAQRAIEGYSALRAHPHLLTDIGLRGYLWKTPHAPGDRDQTLINVGRQQLAMEIVELAGMDPQELYALVPRKPRGEAS